MRRTPHLATIASLGLFLAACGQTGHDADNSVKPLAYVPANTVFISTNLKPLDATTRESLHNASPMGKNIRLSKLREAASTLEKHHDDEMSLNMAHLLHFAADYLDTHDYDQIMADSGIDGKGEFALYSLGLSPVLRGQLKDASQFDTWIQKFEQAYGKNLAEASLDDVPYQYIDLAKGNIQLIIATHDNQFVFALIPKKDTSRLRLALGLDKPDKNMVKAGTLKALVDKQGYDPHWVNYINIAALPALISGEQDTLVHAIEAAAPQAKNTWSRLSGDTCQKELTRITRQMPLITSGYTKLSQDTSKTQVDMTLAPDTIEAFGGKGAVVPDIDNVDKKSLFDLALALPVKTIRDFGLKQANAITSEPFTCPALIGLNRFAVTVKGTLPKLGIPPISNLRGAGIVINDVQTDGDKLENIKARTMLALKDPQTAIDMAKAMLPMLASLDIPSSGEPTSIPPQLLQSLPTPSAPGASKKAWIAQSAHALGVGTGSGEKAKLNQMLNATVSDKNILAHIRVSGKIYTRLLKYLQKSWKVNSLHESAAKDGLNQLEKTLAAIDHVTGYAEITDDGLRLRSKIKRK